MGGCGQTNATVVADLLSSYLPFRDVLLFLSPNHSQACPTVDACTGASAYKTITIVNPLVMSSRPVVTGGTVSCPPTCPGTETTVGPGGMYYTDTCQGGYLNGSVCLQPDTSRYCAFGTGDSCMPCTWPRIMPSMYSTLSHVAGNLNRHGGGCATTPPCLFLGCSYVVNRVGLALVTTLPFTVTSLTFGCGLTLTSWQALWVAFALEAAVAGMIGFHNFDQTAV